MSTYTITWVGDRPRDWGEDRRTFTVGVTDPDGKETRNVKIDQGQNDPAPVLGESVEGAIKKHPRFDDAYVLSVGSPVEVAQQEQKATVKDENIARAVAFKGAVLLAAAGKVEVSEVEMYTEALLRAVTGEGEQGDDGIPF